LKWYVEEFESQTGKYRERGIAAACRMKT